MSGMMRGRCAGEENEVVTEEETPDNTHTDLMAELVLSICR